MFSSTVFLVSIMSYLGLAYAYKPSLDTREAEIKNEVQAQSRKISTSRQEEIVAFYSQINNVEKLISSHVLSSRIFALLEEKTLPTVAYVRFGFTAQTNEVKLTGTTKVFEDINKQARALAEDARVADAVIGNVASDALRNWTFDLTITFSEGALKGTPLTVIPDRTTDISTSTTQ
jgi:hypothetical protein